MLKRLLNTLLILIISSLIGFTLLTLSFSLPDSSIQSNVQISSKMLTHEDLYPEKVEGIKATVMDNFTDALMINSASFNYGGYSAVDKAAGINRFQVDWSNNQIVHLYEHYNDEEAICNIVSYGRYWHGYITLLRPLLMICNYSWIRLIQFMLHISLLFIFATLLKDKTGLLNTFNFFVVYIIFACFVLPYSLQLSQVFNIALVSGCILLCKYDYFSRKNILNYYFLIIGIITSYFDLLTYPIAILGFNLLIITLLGKKPKPKTIVINAIMWFAGYGGMWAMKWVIASLILKENMFVNAYNAIVFRSSDVYNDVKMTLCETILVNLDYINNKITVSLFILMMLTNIIYGLKNKQYNLNVNKLINLIIIIALPLIWYLVVRQHSYTHDFLEFRTLIPLVWGLLSIPSCFLREVEKS